MGIGDEVMGSGLARGAAVRGQRVAFGDGKRILWGPFASTIYRNNPNVAVPGSERASDLFWIRYHKGHRIYNEPAAGRWRWNMNFRALPGEFYFDFGELSFAIKRPNAVLLEPNVPWHKSVAVNKDWGTARWQRLADMLRQDGIRVCQTSYGKVRLANVNVIKVSTFRETAAAMLGFPLVIVPEGGLHHAAAAVGTKAIVIFGGFIPASTMGYHDHINLTGGAEACGSWTRCQHCRDALDRIEVEQVYECARAELYQKDSAVSGRVG